jgi:hypothetical protein
MQTAMQNPSPLALWTGRALSALATAILLADGTVHLAFPELVRPLMEASGFPVAYAPRIGSVALACAVLYALPRTAILGAILATGFLGGAIATHLRLGEMGSPPQLVALAIGAMAWGGLYLRDPRLRALLPLAAGGAAAPAPLRPAEAA